MLAAQEGHVEMVQCLLKFGAEVNVLSKFVCLLFKENSCILHMLFCFVLTTGSNLLVLLCRESRVENGKRQDHVA